MIVIKWLAMLLGSAWAVRLLAAWWPEMTTQSVVILSSVAVFELGCIAFLLRGFTIWHRDPWRLEQERRRADNRMPRKRFG